MQVLRNSQTRSANISTSSLSSDPNAELSETCTLPSSAWDTPGQPLAESATVLEQEASQVKDQKVAGVKKRKAVAFASYPEIRPISPRRRPRKSTLNMDQRVIQTFSSSQVTDEMLEEAATLFSENYGIWSNHAAQKFAKPGISPHILAVYIILISIREPCSIEQTTAQEGLSP